MMRLFSRWKNYAETLPQNNRPIIIKKTKHSLFDNIVGFKDVRTDITTMSPALTCLVKALKGQQRIMGYVYTKSVTF